MKDEQNSSVVSQSVFGRLWTHRFNLSEIKFLSSLVTPLALRDGLSHSLIGSKLLDIHPHTFHRYIS